MNLPIAVEAARVLACAGAKPSAAEWATAQRCMLALAEIAEGLMAVPERARARTEEHVRAWRTLRAQGWSWARIARVSGGFTARGIAARVGPVTEYAEARRASAAAMAGFMIRRGIRIDAVAEALAMSRAEIVALTEGSEEKEAA